MKRFSYPAIAKVGERSVWRPATAAVLLIWVFHFMTVSGIGLFVFGTGWPYLDQRVVVMTFGILLSLGLIALMQYGWEWSFRTKVLVVIVASLLVAVPYATVNWFMMYYLEGDGADWFTPWLIGWSQSAHLFLSIVVAVVAVQYAVRLLAREERLHAIERAARESELRTLRYQVNPHFLFNSLNAVAALVGEGRVEDAEAMVIDLADHYRSALANDPKADVPLRDEVESQRTYALIEQRRFPDRFVFSIEIPEELQAVPVPSLILQPLIENSIKHGVARHSSRTSLKLTATATADGALLIVLRDRQHGPRNPAAPGLKGTGTGLSNIRSRLTTRYGEEASLETERHPDGFEVRVRIPMEKLS